MQNDRPKKLLAVLAHADDETFVIGGTLARYGATGIEVHLLVGTREHGSRGDARASELACAAEHLGITGVEWLDYAPNGMTWIPDDPTGRSLVSASEDDVARAILDVMERVTPDVVVTFDATGGYGHPDHIAIGRATGRAFAMATQQPTGGPSAPRKLYGAHFGRRVMQAGVLALRLAPGRDPRRFGPSRDIDLVAALAASPAPTTYIDVRQHLQRRLAAVRCHASQLADAPWFLRRYETLPAAVRGFLFPREVFSRVWPPARARELERDLFAGL